MTTPRLISPRAIRESKGKTPGPRETIDGFGKRIPIPKKQKPVNYKVADYKKDNYTVTFNGEHYLARGQMCSLLLALRDNPKSTYRQLAKLAGIEVSTTTTYCARMAHYGFVLIYTVVVDGIAMVTAELAEGVEFIGPLKQIK